MKEKKVKISTEYIQLQSLLKFEGIVGTGGEAKEAIQAGYCKVNGEICTQRGKKIRTGDTVNFNDQILMVIE